MRIGELRLFSSRLSLPFAAFLLMGFAVLSSSSGADDALFARTQGELERLWSGVLGCADGHEPHITRNRLDDSGSFEDTDSEAVPTGTSGDYSQCGKQSLRNTSSRMIIDTIEGALRQGGLALFEDGFQVDSSISWVFGDNFQGELDVVVPVWSSTRLNGEGSVLFLQPGAAFWPGIDDDLRSDANLGVVYRTNLLPDVVAGVSVFYDRNFERGHSRLGLGADAQSGNFHGSFNYYHPLTDEEDGREDDGISYIERAQRGSDLTFAFGHDTFRLSGSLGYWRFEGEDEEKTQWHPSYGFDAGFRVLPGVFVEGGYEHHDSEDSLGSRWSAGLSVRFALPGLDGAMDFESGNLSSPYLWRVVEREKRILYEEFIGLPRVNLTASHSVQMEGEMATVTLALSDPLEEDVELHLITHEASTATLGPDGDFSLGYTVFEVDAETGEESRPAGDPTDCPISPCEVAIPSGVTTAEVLMDIHDDSDDNDREQSEYIEMRVHVPEAHAALVHSRDVVRVTIAAHGNTVAFDSASDTELLENTAGPTSNGTPPVPGTAEVAVLVDLPAPRPITLDVNVDPSSTAEPEDYSLPSALTIPAGQPGGTITLTGIDDSDGEEGSETIVLSLSARGSLPEGWSLDETTTHEVTIRDDDLSVGFAVDDLNGTEPANGSTDFSVRVSLTVPPSAELTVPVEIDATGTTARVSGGSEDVTYTSTSLTFDANTQTLSQNIILTVNADDDAEGAETVRLRIGDHSSYRSGGNDFSIGRETFTLTILANDNTISFDSASDTELEENRGTANVKVNVNQPTLQTITLNVDVDSSSTAESGDYSLPSTVTIPATQPSGTITLRGIDDPDGEGNEDIILSLSASGVLPEGWTLDETATHTVTIRDDDLAIGFAVAERTEPEPESATGDTQFTVAVEVTVSPEANLTVPIGIDTAATSASAAAGGDVTYTPTSLTFNANTQTLSQDITFTVRADSTAEEDERLRLRISDDSSFTSGGNNFSVGQRTFDLIIPANDNTVSFDSSSDAEFGENRGTANVRVNVDRPAPTTITLNVNVDSSSTADPSNDFSLPSTVTIRAEQPRGMITLTGVHDDISEGNETVVLSLSAPAGGLPEGWTVDETATYELRILDDDLAIGFAVAERTEPEPAMGTTTFTVAVEVTVSPEVELTVPIGVDTTATSASVTTGGDVEYTPTSLTFAANTETLSQDITFTVRDDSVAEEDERLRLRISDHTSFTDGGNNFSVGQRTFDLIIPANDNVVRLDLADDASVEEGGTLSVSLATEGNNPAPSSGLPIVVTVTPQGSASDNDISYTRNRSFSGMPPFNFNITADGDTDAEAPEVFDISIVAGANFPSSWGSVDSATAAFTIPANDNIIELASTSQRFTLQEHATTIQSGIVVLDIDNPAALADALSSNITLTHTATIAGDEDDTVGNDIEVDDFVIDATTGQATLSGLGITFGALTDTVPELDEVATITFTDDNDVLPEGWEVNSGNNSLTVTIPANDNEFALGAPADAAIDEGGDGTTLELSFTNPPPSETVLRIDFDDRNGSGVERDDGELDVNFSANKGAVYSKTDETLTIPANVDSPVTLTVEAEDDTRPESDEMFTLQLNDSHASNSLPDGFAIASGQAQHVITINAADNTVGFASASSELVEGAFAPSLDGNLVIEASEQLPGQTALPTFILRSDNPDVLIRRTHDRHLYNSSSGELTIRSGSAINTNRRPRVQEVDISLGIAVDEDAMSEEATLTLDLKSGESLPEGWELGRKTHTVKIFDKDVPVPRTVFFETDSAEIAEDASNNVSVTLRISPPPTAPISIPVTAEGDSNAYTSRAGAQGASFGGTVDFAANDGDARLFLIPQEDGNAVSEVITFTIGTLPANYTVAEHASWTVTINDIDAPKGDVGFAPNQPANGAEGASVSLKVMSTVAADEDLEIAWEVEPGDEVNTSAGTVTIPMGENEASFEIGIRTDGIAEGSETITVKLGGANLPRGWSLSSETGEHEIRIDANENNIGFKDESTRVLTEGAPVDGGTSVDLGLFINKALPQASTISLVSDNPDVRIVPRVPTMATYSGTTLTIPAGENEIFLTVTSIEDTDDMHDSATLTLANLGLPQGWEIARSANSLPLSILDQDAANFIGFASTSTIIDETLGDRDDCAGETRENCVKIVLHTNPHVTDPGALGGLALLNRSGEGQVTRDIFLLSSSSSSVPQRTRTIAYTQTDVAGGTEIIIPVYINDDTVFEGDEVFTLSITDQSAPTGYIFLEKTHTITILSSENTLDVAAVPSGEFFEGDVVPVTLTLSNPAPSNGLPVNVTVAPQGSASAEDISFLTSVNIPAGANEFDVEVSIVEDTVAESQAESFVFSITAGADFPASWGSVATTTQTINVAEDGEDHVSFRSSNPATASEGDAVDLSVELNKSYTESLTFNWEASPANAVQVSSGQVTVAASATMNSTPIHLVFRDDKVAELQQDITVTLTDVDTTDNYAVHPVNGKHVIALAASDNTIRFSREEASLGETGSTFGGTLDNIGFVSIVVDNPLPTLADIQLRISGTAEGEGKRGEEGDYFFSVGNHSRANGGLYNFETDILTLPHSIGQVGLGVDSNPDTDADHETIIFEISDNNLPEGWTIVEPSTTTVYINDAQAADRNNNIGFARSNITVREGDSIFDLSLSLRNAGGGPLHRDGVVRNTPVALPLMLSFTGNDDGDLEHSGEVVIIPAGTSVANSIVSVPHFTARDDSLPESIETVTVTLAKGASFPSGWEIDATANTFRINIQDNDTPTSTLGFADAMISTEETRSASQQIQLMGALKDASGNPLTNLAVALPFALSIDVQANDGDISLDDTGEVATSVSLDANGEFNLAAVTIIDDEETEADETFIIRLARGGNFPSGWSIDDDANELSVTIDQNDQPESFVQFVDKELNIAEEVDGLSATVRVAISPQLSSEASIGIDAAGTALFLSDYTFDGTHYRITNEQPLEGIITLPAGADEATFAVIAAGDGVDEPDEQIEIRLVERSGDNALPSPYEIGKQSRLIVNLADGDDPPPNVIRFADNAPVSASEGGETVAVSLVVPAPPPEDIELRFFFVGTAGEASGSRANDYSVTTIGGMYEASRAILTIPAGEDDVRITLDIEDDFIVDPEETITMVMRANGPLPEGFGVAPEPNHTHTVTIADNDIPAFIGFESRESRIEEPGSATLGHEIPLYIRGVIPRDFVLDAAVDSASTATNNTDFAVQRLFLEAGDKAPASILVDIKPDNNAENDETIILVLDGNSLPDGLGLAGITTHAITIPANDNAVQFGGVIDGIESLGEAAGSRTEDIRVSLPQHSESGNVDIAMRSSGSATEGSDYDITVKSPATATYANGVLSIPPGEGMIDLTITVVDDSPDDDDVDFDNETIILTLSDPNGNLPSGWFINTGEAGANVFGHIQSLSIADDDNPAASTITFGTTAVTAEETTGSQNGCASFTAGVKNCIATVVHINPGITGAEMKATLTLADASGSALSTDDVFITGDESSDRASTTDLIFENTDGQAGGNRKTIYIHIVDDDIVEETKTFTLTISDLSDGISHTLVNDTFTLTLTDDDKPTNTIGFESAGAVTDETRAAGQGIRIRGVLKTPDGGVVPRPDVPIPFTLTLSTTGDIMVDGAGAVSDKVFTDALGAFDLAEATIIDDADREDAEAVTITLGKGVRFPDGWSIEPGADEFEITINSNDNLISFGGFVDSTASLGEADGSQTEDIRLAIDAAHPDEAITLNILSSGTATEEADYEISVKSPTGASYSKGVLTIPATEDTVDLTITVMDDAVDDEDVDFDDFDNEEIILTIDPLSSLPNGWRVDAREMPASSGEFNNIFKAVITDNDTAAASTAGWRTTHTIVNETVPNSPCANYYMTDDIYKNCFRVVIHNTPKITGIPGTLITLGDEDGNKLTSTDDIFISDEELDLGQAVEVGHNYSNTRALHDPNYDWDVYIVNDDKVEGDRVYTLTIEKAPGGYTLVNPVHTITILDDDFATASFAEGSSTGQEDVANSSSIEITLSHAAPVGGLPLRLAFDNTTSAPSYVVSDAAKASYSQGNGLLTINEGETSVTLTGSQTSDQDNIDNEYVITLEKGENFPRHFVIDSDKNVHTAIFDDLTPNENTIGWAMTEVSAMEGAADSLVRPLPMLKLTDVIGGGGAFTYPIPEFRFTTTINDAVTGFLISLGNSDGTSDGDWSGSTGEVRLRAGKSYNDGLIDVLFDITDDIFEEGTVLYEYTISPVNFPRGWEVDPDNDTLTITVHDDEVPVPGGSNVIEFVETGAGISEAGEESVSTIVRITHPNRNQMKFSLAPQSAPASSAGTEDYNYDVTLPSDPSADIYDESNRIVTLPGGASEIELMVTAEDDRLDDDLEVVNFKLEEAGAVEVLPEGWRIGERDTFAVTVFDNDGSAGAPTATLSEWTRSGSTKGGIAQLSSTTAEDTPFELSPRGAVYLTEKAPAPEGLNLILTVPIEHADDVEISNGSSLKSSVTKGSVDGQYLFNVKAGESDATFYVNVTNDNFDEPIEAFDITLSEGANFPSNWTLREEVAYRLVIPVDENDTIGTIGFDLNAVATVTEGASFASPPTPTNAIELPINIFPALSENIMLAISVTGDGVQDGEYNIYTITASGATYANGFLSIPSGTTETSFVFATRDDEESEINEEAIVTLSGELPPRLSFAERSRTITIIDDDRKIGFAASTDTVNRTSVFEDVGAVTLTVVPVVPFSGDGTLEWSASPTDSLSGATSGSIDLNQGDTSKTFTISVNDDSTLENSEEITITLAAGSLPPGWQLDDDSHVIAVAPSDGTLEFASSFADTTAVEGDMVAVTLSSDIDAPSDGLPITVSVAPQGGDAAAEDVMFSELQTIPAGQREHSFNIEIREDDTYEGAAEEFLVGIAAGMDFPNGWGTVSTDTRTITVSADDNTIRFAQAMLTVSEDPGFFGTANTRMFRIDIDAALPTAADITINFDGNHEDGDYSIDVSDGDKASGTSYANGVLTIGAGDGQIEMKITANPDAMEADNEVFTLTFDGSSLPEGLHLEDPPSSLEITIEDAESVVGFKEAFSRMAENVGMVELEVVAGFEAPEDITLNVTVQDIAPTAFTATATKDYVLVTTRLTIPKGQKTGTVQLNIMDDNDMEGGESNESVELIISASGSLPDGWRISIPEHELTIENDDSVVGFAAYTGIVFNNLGGAVNEPIVFEDAENVFVRVQSTQPAPMGGFDLKYQVTSGASQLASTHQGVATITFPGENGGDTVADFNITWMDDSTPEPEATVTLKLLQTDSNLPDGWTFGKQEYTFDLVDDDNRIGFAASSSDVAENVQDGMASVMVNVNGSAPPSNITLDVSVETSGTTATEGSEDDYLPLSPSLTISTSQTQGAIQIGIVNDSKRESDEDVVLSIAASGDLPRGWSLGTMSHTLTIKDDDREVSFADGAPSEIMEDGVSVSAELQIMPPLAADVTIPLFITGDSDAYTISTSPASAALSTRPDNQRSWNGTVSFVQADGDSVTFSIVPKKEEDRTDDSITVAIDAANLPYGYSVGSNPSWELNIVDIDKRVVSFTDERRGDVSEDGFTINTIQIMPPPTTASVSIPLTIIGDPDAYTISLVSSGSATISSDGMIDFPRGQGSVRIRVDGNRDLDREEEDIAITIDDANLPPGYRTGTISSWEFKIKDSGQRAVSFLRADVDSVRENGYFANQRLYIYPPLTENVVIPLIITGDPDAYTMRTVSPSGAITVQPIDASTARGEVAFALSAGSSEFVTLELQGADDEDNDPETVTLTIDESQLPPGYGVGSIPSWRIDIADDSRVVSFGPNPDTAVFRDRVTISEGGRASVQLRVSPPLEAGQNLAVPLRSTYSIVLPNHPFLLEWPSGEYSISAISPRGARYENGVVHFDQRGDADSVTLEFRSRRDPDHFNERINISIDGPNLPLGFVAGDNSSWELNSTDNTRPNISFAVQDVTEEDVGHDGWLTLNKRVGDVINVRVESRNGNDINRRPGPAINLGVDTPFDNPGIPGISRPNQNPIYGSDSRGGEVVLAESNGGITDWEVRREGSGDNTYNIRFTARRAGSYTVRIAEVPSGTVIGEISRINIRIQ